MTRLDESALSRYLAKNPPTPATGIIHRVGWGFVIPGQPVSWNRAYRVGVKSNARGDQYRTIVKTEEAKAYTQSVTRSARDACPPGWPRDERLIVVEFRLYLGRAVDADNTMKMVNDGLEAALGVDDKWFMPRAMWIEWGLRPAQRRVEIRIVDFLDPVFGSP